MRTFTLVESSLNMSSHQDRDNCAWRNSRVLSQEDIIPEGFKWIGLRKIEYMDPTGTVRPYEACARTTKTSGVDAAYVIAMTKDRHIILVKQFRPPTGNYVIEFPAGLLDHGEKASVTALRELEEETGYIATLKSTSMIGYTEPGMCSTNMKFVFVDITGKQAPMNEEDEFIEVLKVPLDNLAETLANQVLFGNVIESSLLAFALGMKESKNRNISGSISAHVVYSACVFFAVSVGIAFSFGFRVRK